MKIELDKERCAGHAMCNFTAPDVYDLDDYGYSTIRSEEVPAGLEEQARLGANACPERALRLLTE